MYTNKYIHEHTYIHTYLHMHIYTHKYTHSHICTHAYTIVTQKSNDKWLEQFLIHPRKDKPVTQYLTANCVHIQTFQSCCWELSTSLEIYGCYWKLSQSFVTHDNFTRYFHIAGTQYPIKATWGNVSFGSQLWWGTGGVESWAAGHSTSTVKKPPARSICVQFTLPLLFHSPPQSVEWPHPHLM